MNLIRAIIGFSLSLVFLSFFVYSISSVGWVFKNLPESQNKGLFLGSVSDSFQNRVIENVVIPTAEPEINAGSAVSVQSDLLRARNVLFIKNGNLKLPIASLTKLMTAIVALDNYNLSEVTTVSKIADSQSTIKQDIKLDDKMLIGSFLDIMIVGSSNKSAYALSEVIGTEKFVGLMNHKARELGLKNTFFADPTGLSPRNTSTANDMARLVEYILIKYPKIADISKLKDLNVQGFGRVVNTDQLLEEFPDAVCSKTGFTEEAKGCLVLVVNNQKSGGYLINVILGAEDRFTEMRKLINWSSEICN